MKKKIIAILLSLTMLISLFGCAASKGSKNYTAHTGLIKIVGQDNLYYDPQTRIVYIIFNEAMGNCGYGYMSAYYASNGLPYQYDTNNNILIEIGE